MSLYDAAKDALKIAQKADNIDLIQKLLDVQQMALDMQEKQQQLQGKLSKAEAEILSLKDSKKFTFAEGHNYLIDESDPTRRLCPICTKKNGFAVPLSKNDKYCHTCKGQYF
jgi:hypothetical protein